MADEQKQKKSDEKSGAKSEEKRDAGAGLEEASERGYLGPEREKEYENEEYALTSGPDSPPYPLGGGKGGKKDGGK